MRSSSPRTASVRPCLFHLAAWHLAMAVSPKPALPSTFLHRAEVQHHSLVAPAQPSALL